MTAHQPLTIGWAEIDITPKQPVSISGDFALRISEGVSDPLMVTAWAMEKGDEQAIFVSCDVVTIPDDFRDAVRMKLAGNEAGLDPTKVILHATHTHHAPEIHVRESVIGHTSATGNGVELHEISPDLLAVETYVQWMAERVAEAIRQAWSARAPGGIGFGMGFAVIGRNRRWVDRDGKSTMHGLGESAADRFRYIEGYEDHSIQVMATYDEDKRLTGLIVNLACTAQTPGNPIPNYISADFWCETRIELRKRFGEHLFILPQCSAAGDQTAYEQYDKKALDRMLRLKRMTMRQEIAHRIADAMEDILPAIRTEIGTTPVMRHHVETVDLIANRLTEEDVRQAEQEARMWQQEYEREKEKLAKQPELCEAPRWYSRLTSTIRRKHWVQNVLTRYELQKANPFIPAEIHVLRLGEVIFASIPFEYYLDYGIQIKVRSPATQTFIVQLAGDGTYVPTPRSIVGGGYGSIAASNPVGCEGGQQLAEYVVRTMRWIWKL